MKFITYHFFFITIFLTSMGFSLGQTTNISTSEVVPGVYRLFVNNAVAVVAFTGNDGTLLVDAAYENTANALFAEIETLTSQPLKYIVNTHIHGDHTGGNLALGKNVNIVAHQNVKTYLSKEQVRGERVLSAFPDFALPNITFSEKLNLDFNEQEVQLLHLAGGHTNGDIIVYFPESKILAVGDLLFAGFFPFVDVNNGGNPFQFLENIEFIIGNYPDDTIIIGGHGPVYSMQQYSEYRQTLQETIDVLKRHKLEGMTLEQMKDQRVLKNWEEWGSFFITEDRWIDTLYPFL